MTYAIETDVPRLEPMVGNACKYPFRQMNVGESFLVRCAAADFLLIRNRIRSASRIFRTTYNRDARFETRKVAKGARCWRIA